MPAGRPRKYASKEEWLQEKHIRQRLGLTAYGRKRIATRKRSRLEIEQDTILNQIAVDYWLGIHNRNRAFSTYGKNDPIDKLPSVQVVRVKDKHSQPTGHAVHVEPLPRKYVDGLTVHTEGEDQARRTKPFPHSTDMPRKHKTFCAVCTEIVVDGDIDNVRITVGVYLPIEHDCNSVRVYDLRGTLLEVKPL